MRFLNRLLALTAVLLVTPVLGSAQSSSDPVTAIRAGRMIDVDAGRVVEGATIIVRGDRIETVGPNASIPAGAEVIDLGGYTVLPGLIDTHTHLTSDPSGGDAAGSLRQWPGYAALVGAKNARLTLEAGFTTVRNVGGGEWADVALRDAIEAGIAHGPRIFAGANSLGITGGHCDMNGFRPDLRAEPGPEQGIANGSAEVKRAVRYQIKYGADVIKFCATGGVLSAGDAVGVQQFTYEEMRTIVETAAFAERKVAAHAHGLEGIKDAVRAGVASIEHGSILDDEVIELMKERGTYLVPTRMAFEAVVAGAHDGTMAPWAAEKALEIAPFARESVARAIQAGVPVAFGTDAGVFPHGTNAEEFSLLVEAGMTPMQAIQSATVHAARLLDQEDALGSLQAGHIADIIAVRGDPLSDVELLESVDFVMKEGVVYKTAGAPVAPVTLR